MSLSPMAGVGGAGISSSSITGVGGVGISKGAASPAYTGPLDKVPGAYWGISALRAPGSALLGQEGYTLKKLDGGEEPTQAFSYAGTSPAEVDIGAINTFLDSDDGAVVSVKDGSGNAVNFTGPGTDAVVWEESGGLPQFTVGAGQLLGSCNFSAGARTYVFVFNYIENATGVSFFGQEGEGFSMYLFSVLSQINDIGVQIDTDEESVTFSTGQVLMTGRHLLEFQFDASGNLSIVLDGADVPVSVVGGEPFQLPATAGDDVRLAFSNNTVPQGLNESYAWPLEDMGSAARSDIATVWGITLP